MKKIFEILTIIIIVICCSCGQRAQTVNKTDENSFIAHSLIVVKHIDSLIENHDISSFSTSYLADDTIKLTLFYDKEQVYKLTYPFFSVVGEFVGYNSVYFNSKEPICIKEVNKEKLVFFNLSKGEFFDEIKSKDKGIVDYNRQCEIVKNIDNLMHKFSELGRYKIVECLNSNTDFSVGSDSLPIYVNPSPNSEKIKYLQSGQKLKYVLADSKTYPDEKVGDYYFIKVKIASSNINGWVKSTEPNLFRAEEGY